MAVSLDDAYKALSELGEMHTVLPITDPTKYRQVVKDLSDNETLVGLFCRFRKELEKLVDDARARQPGYEGQRTGREG